MFNRRTGLLAAGLVVFGFLATNLILSSLYQDRIYPGVKLGELSLGGLTRHDARAALNAQAKAYHLALVVDNIHHNVKPADIGAGYDVDLTVEQAFNAGRANPVTILGMLEASRQVPLTLAYSINRSKMTSFASTFVGSQAAAPVDAAVVIKDGVPIVVPDKPGLGVNRAALIAALEQSFGSGTQVLRIQRGAVPADLQTAVATTEAERIKPLIATPIILTYSDKTFQPSAAQIGSWWVFSKQVNGTLGAKVDNNKILGYIKTFSAQVEVPAVIKRINVVNGQVKSEEGGTDGLAINQDSLVAQIGAAVMAGKALTLAVPTVAVPFKTQYNRSVTLDAPQYIEVNLSTQHLWAYQDHQVVYESAVTSGATGLGFPTVTGLFSIQSKERNRYLDGRPLGYHYNVFVEYWMPFTGNYGLHDASWRNGNFGEPDYYYGGSHGCVNLPTATAAWLYNWASVGTPVWVHI